MKNKHKQKRRKKREVLKDLLPKNLKDWKKLPNTERGTTTPSNSKTSA
ncbi:hypothetical protein [Salibacterium aidingense]|nr:hypothetical protein [Salibacterium aidingense]